MDIITANGKSMKSSSENSQYGHCVNFNWLFIGTGGAFGIPINILLKIHKRKDQTVVESRNLADLNQFISDLRKIKQENKKYSLNI